MRIGIDARFYGPIGTGIGIYTQNLLNQLQKLDQDNEYFIFLRRENFNLFQIQNPRFHKILADYQWYSIKEQILFPLKLHKYKLDLVHFAHFNVPLFYFKKFIVTIHDLIQRDLTKKDSKLPAAVFYFKKAVYFLVIKNALKRAKKIIAVSNFSKEKILKYYKKIDAHKIEVIYEAGK